jgi:hypothetical protein
LRRRPRTANVQKARAERLLSVKLRHDLFEHALWSLPLHFLLLPSLRILSPLCLSRTICFRIAFPQCRFDEAAVLPQLLGEIRFCNTYSFTLSSSSYFFLFFVFRVCLLQAGLLKLVTKSQTACSQLYPQRLSRPKGHLKTLVDIYNATPFCKSKNAFRRTYVSNVSQQKLKTA